MEEVWTKVADLGPSSRKVNVVVKVLETGDVREVRLNDGKIHTVTDVLVGDETGTVYLALWDENISRVDQGSTYAIKNGYTSLFRGSIRLNVGRYGEIDQAEQEIGEVNTSNNIYERTYPDRRRSYGGYSSSRGRGDSWQSSRGRW
ncbi:MAG: single-stranded DNA-binding protein, partial [Candidatus Thorarchaeota archaeon]